MKSNTLSLILFTFLSINSTAQETFREFITNDSTEYVLNSDTTIVVSRNKVYFRTIEEMTLIHDFSTADPTMYIVDFDTIILNI